MVSVVAAVTTDEVKSFGPLGRQNRKVFKDEELIGLFVTDTKTPNHIKFPIHIFLLFPWRSWRLGGPNFFLSNLDKNWG